MKKGFTLIEILVVMGILSIIGTLFVIIFSSSLKGSNKTQIISIIKQNGQSVLENMDKVIRGADDVVCPSITLSAITPPSANLVVVSKGTYTRYRFIAPVCNNDICTVNGFIQQDNPTKQAIPTNPLSSVACQNITALGCREETAGEFVNRVCTPADPLLLTAIVLTDTNTQTGVSVVNGSFARVKPAGFRDQVTIRFDLSPGVKVPQAITGQIDPVNFETTIQLR